MKVFDAYAQFEESMINAKMESDSEEGSSETGELTAYYRHTLTGSISRTV